MTLLVVEIFFQSIVWIAFILHMNLARLDLNLLAALEALLEEVSVGGAARKMALSQPAMSHTLKRLRYLFSDPLLVRVGARMRLTARGEALRLPVRDVLSRARDLLTTQDFDPSKSTRAFELFVSDYAGDLIMPPLQRRLEKEAAGISIRVHQLAVIRQESLEHLSGVDLAIACVTKGFQGFYQQRLFTDRDACVVRAGSPLSRRLSNLRDLLDAKHVAVVGTEFAEDPVDTWLREEGYRRSIAITVPRYLQALHMVSQSELVAIVPERLVRTYSSALNLEVRRVPLDVGTFDEYLLHPATKHADSGCVWLRSVLAEIGKSLGPLPALRMRARASGEA